MRLEVDPIEPMQAHELDQDLDLRLGITQPHGPAAVAQPPSQRSQVEHQRSVGEGELRKVDHHVTLCLHRSGQGGSPQRLSGAVLIATATEKRLSAVKDDDGGNLYQQALEGKARGPICDGLAQISYTRGMPTVEDVTDALRDVIDPELGLDFVELGLIYDVEVDEGTVRVTYTLTSPGCPIGPQVAEQIEEFVGDVDGVQDVQPTMTFSPPWTPERMSEDAKFALGF